MTPALVVLEDDPSFNADKDAVLTHDHWRPPIVPRNLEDSGVRSGKDMVSRTSMLSRHRVTAGTLADFG